MDLVKLFYHLISYKCIYVLSIVVCCVTIFGFQLYFGDFVAISLSTGHENQAFSLAGIDNSVLNKREHLYNEVLSNDILSEETNKTDNLGGLIGASNVIAFDRDEIPRQNDANDYTDHNTSTEFNIYTLININKDAYDMTSENQIDGKQTLNNSNPAVDQPHGAPSTKTILFWIPGNKRSRSGHIHCPASSCITTDNQMQLSAAGAVVFNVFYLPNGTIPRQAHPRQVFVFLDYESQWRTNYRMSRSSSPFAFLNDYYNITMTFKDHRDTDIYAPYGAYVVQDAGIKDPLPSAENIRDKTEYVAWMVSNCNAPSSRMVYYKELCKHISVHMYGKCGNRACGYGCDTHISRHYRFYLAFENSFCEDYATEKASYIFIF